MTATATGGHVAVVLPGQAYRADLPVLRYPAAALAQSGADIRVVRYPDTASRALDDPGFHAEVAESVGSLTAGAKRVTLIGKSLGTAAMAMLPDGVPAAAADAIWLTPVFGMGDLAGRAGAKRWRSLYVFGTADRAHDPAAQRAVAEATGGSEVAIEGADHSLEVAGDVMASVAAMHTLAAAVLEFVRAGQ